MYLHNLHGDQSQHISSFLIRRNSHYFQSKYKYIKKKIETTNQCHYITMFSFPCTTMVRAQPICHLLSPHSLNFKVALVPHLPIDKP